MSTRPTSPERCLLLAVLGEQLVLAIRERDLMQIRGSDPLAARRWIGSAAFREVCSLAGVDPDWIERMVRDQLARPLRHRTAEAFPVRGVSSHLSVTRSQRLIGE